MERAAVCVLTLARKYRLLDHLIRSRVLLEERFLANPNGDWPQIAPDREGGDYEPLDGEGGLTDQWEENAGKVMVLVVFCCY